MFFLFAVSVMTLICGYIGWRIILPFGLSSSMNLISAGLILVLIVMLFSSLLLRFHGHYNYGIYILTWISYLFMGFMSIIFLFLLARDLFLILAVVLSKLISLAHSLSGNQPSGNELLDPGRRHFLVYTLNIVILGITGILTGWGVYKALSGPKIKNVTIPIKHLHDDLDGFRIVQISDLHAGSTIRGAYIRKVVNMANSLKGDVIVLTGDIADGGVSNLHEHVLPLADLTAPYGLYFVTGNHEYYSGVDQWTAEMQKLGFYVLNNENRIIYYANGRLLVAGVNDYDARHFGKIYESDPAASIASADQYDVSLLLAHQPRSIYKAAEAGFDLVISGHTHGGQYFPWNFFVGLQQPYSNGLHIHENTHIYVSSGTGYWGPPLRGGIPSEITVLTLKKA